MTTRDSSPDSTSSRQPWASERVLRLTILLLGVVVVVGMLGFAGYVSTR
jgi:hypothetical protein